MCKVLKQTILKNIVEYPTMHAIAISNLTLIETIIYSGTCMLTLHTTDNAEHFYMHIQGLIDEEYRCSSRHTLVLVSKNDLYLHLLPFSLRDAKFQVI